MNIYTLNKLGREHLAESLRANLRGFRGASHAIAAYVVDAENDADARQDGRASLEVSGLHSLTGAPVVVRFQTEHFDAEVTA